MDTRAFERTYGLDLIQGALETLTMGKCVWDGGVFTHPKMTHPGMPDYIFNAFVSKGLLSGNDAQKIIDSLRDLQVVDAAFAQINIELELEDATDLNIPNNIQLTNNFDLKSVKKFTISSSKGKELPNLIRIQIDSLLDELKDKFWNDYKDGLRKAYMITQLYYGTLNITIDTNLENSFEGSLQDTSKITNKLKFDHSVSYSFENSKVPFAMRIERLKKFDA